MSGRRYLTLGGFPAEPREPAPPECGRAIARVVCDLCGPDDVYCDVPVEGARCATCGDRWGAGHARHVDHDFRHPDPHRGRDGHHSEDVVVDDADVDIT